MVLHQPRLGSSKPDVLLSAKLISSFVIWLMPTHWPFLVSQLRSGPTTYLYLPVFFTGGTYHNRNELITRLFINPKDWAWARYF